MAAGKHVGFGIDIGGTGVKGAIVDLDTGEFIGERHRIETPSPSTPELIAGAVKEIVDTLEWDGPVGITVPGIVRHGVVGAVGNIDQSWPGTDARALFSDVLGGRDITVLNDADAAGVAELKFGEGIDDDGLVILLTFGTGIGSALLYRGVLVPNTELGHLELDGKMIEKQASAKVRTDNDWSFAKWSKKVSKALAHYEHLFSPDLFIVGGGVSRKADKWVPLLTNETPVVPAVLRNAAGIVGAALSADVGR